MIAILIIRCAVLPIDGQNCHRVVSAQRLSDAVGVLTRRPWGDAIKLEAR